MGYIRDVEITGRPDTKHELVDLIVIVFCFCTSILENNISVRFRSKNVEHLYIDLHCSFLCGRNSQAFRLMARLLVRAVQSNTSVYHQPSSSIQVSSESLQIDNMISQEQPAAGGDRDGEGKMSLSLQERTKSKHDRHIKTADKSPSLPEMPSTDLQDNQKRSTETGLCIPGIVQLIILD